MATLSKREYVKLRAMERKMANAYFAQTNPCRVCGKQVTELTLITNLGTCGAPSCRNAPTPARKGK